MASSPPLNGNGASYYVCSPGGEHIRVPRELYMALKRFMVEEKLPGKIELHFRNGGIADLKALVEVSYKT